MRLRIERELGRRADGIGDFEGLVAAALETAREDLGFDLIFEPDAYDLDVPYSCPIVAPGGDELGRLMSRTVLDSDQRASVKALAGILGRRAGALDLSDSIPSQLSRIGEVIRDDAVRTALQPIFDLEHGSVVGYEALSRFPVVPRLSPQTWFAEAEAAGLGLQLERVSAAKALTQFARLPDSAFLAINASPALAVDRCFREAMRHLPHDRIVIEMTEHSAIEDYEAFEQRLQRRRIEGVQLAVDDTGAGFASLRHILRLRPELIKLDLSLIRGIDLDGQRQALVAAITTFARSLGSRVVAEGIESDAELRKVQDLGVDLGQGYLLGMPEVQPDLPGSALAS